MEGSFQGGSPHEQEWPDEAPRPRGNVRARAVGGSGGRGEGEGEGEWEDQLFPDEIVIRLNHGRHAPLAVIGVSSLIQVVAASIACHGGHCTKNEAYAVSVGAVSLLVCCLMATVEVHQPDFFDLAHTCSSAFLLVWWFVGAAITTFLGPFNEIHNGFFASWLALFASLNYASHTLPGLHNALAHIKARSHTTNECNRLLLLIFATSLVVLVASAVGCSSGSSYRGDAVWGVICGCVSCSVTLVLLLCPQPFSSVFGVQNAGFVLAIWWIVSASVLTFGKTFEAAGNGFFACWGCCIASVYLACLDSE